MKVTTFLAEESGQTIVAGALAMFVLVSIVGMAIDVGSLRATQRKLQIAAEAAAIAGALQIPACSGQAGCTSMQTAAQAALTENGLTGGTLGVNCATPGAGLSLVLNNPPCAVAADPNKANANFVEALVSEPQSTYFARLVGFTTFSIHARAEAARTGNPNCVYALDPTGGNAITVSALATLTSSCGIVDESNAANAFSCSLLATVNAPQLKVVGGASGFLCTANPAPRTNAALPSPADPLASLPKPAVPACGTSLSSPYTGSPIPLALAGFATLKPGTYCGGITIAPGANVTFDPGTYVLRAGGLFNLQGGLAVNLASTVSGNGVTFYNYGPAGAITFSLTSLSLGTVSLIAPSSGTYSGILFFQDPQDTAGATILGSGGLNTNLQGGFYFPTATVTTALSGTSQYNLLVAKDIVFTTVTFGATTLNTSSYASNYSSLSNGSPLSGSGAVLIQ